MSTEKKTKKNPINFQFHKDLDSPNPSNVSVPGLSLNYLWQGLFSVYSQSFSGRSLSSAALLMW